MQASGEARRSRATLIGCVSIILWALLAPLTVFASGIPTFQLLAMSFGTAFISGIVLLAVRGPAALRELRQPFAPWMTAFVSIFAYHALYFYALAAAPAAEASLIAYLWPLFIVLMSALLPGERLLPRHVIGALLGLGGTAFIIFGRNTVTEASAPLAGYTAALLCALVWSGYSVSNRRFSTTPSSMIVGICGAVALAGLVCHILLEKTIMPDTTQWLAILLLGTGPTGLAFLAWDHATKHGHLALLGSLSYLAPLLSTLLLVLIGSAAATLPIAIAALMIVGGAVIATGTLSGFLQKKRT